MNNTNKNTTNSQMLIKSPTTASMLAQSTPSNSQQMQEDETYYTRELIQIYGQPIVPSFHKQFNYQLSNTHYGYRTLRRLLNCDILKNYVKITKEEIKSLDRRLVEFVQLTEEKCLQAFQLNLTCFFDAKRFENGIIKNWLDVWYVDRLKEKYNFPVASLHHSSSMPSFMRQQQNNHQHNHHNQSMMNISTSTPSYLTKSNTSPWSLNNLMSSFESTNFFQTTPSFGSNCSSSLMTSQAHTQMQSSTSECDETNHLWFCLRDYSCTKMDEFLFKLKDYIKIQNNRSELILVHTAFPIFEYKDIMSETRRLLALYLQKFTPTKSIDELIDNQKFPPIAKQHIYNLVTKFLNVRS